MKFEVLDHTGHSTYEFTDEQKAEAAALFDSLMDLNPGMLAATRKDGSRDYKVIRSPDQVQDETLFVPRRVGG